MEAPTITKWRPALALVRLQGQLNAKAPNRSRKSDGIIGDTAHAGRGSDHNPHVKDRKGVGVVTAIDITHDPRNGIDCERIVNSLVKSRDARIEMIIWQGKIISAIVSPWKWRKYGGTNPHKTHFHLSVREQSSLYDRQTEWKI